MEFALNGVPRHQATAVTHGAAALALVAEVVVDLVILDVDRPGLDGFAVHDLLRARPGIARTPSLFMHAADAASP